MAFSSKNIFGVPVKKDKILIKKRDFDNFGSVYNVTYYTAI